MMTKDGKILIIDDNEDVLFALNLLLEPVFEKIKVTTQPDRIRYFMETYQPDVILLDMNFCRDAISGQEGFEYLGQILTIDPQAVVVFMTAYADTEKAVRAIKGGCHRLYLQTVGKGKTAGHPILGAQAQPVQKGN